MISYALFWKTLKDLDISAYALIKYDGISSNTINRLRHDLPIDTKTLDRLCKALRCYSVGEIIKFIPDK